MWGSSFVLARYATTHGVAPTTYTLWHVVGPIAVLWLLNFRRFNLFKVLQNNYKFFLIVACTGIVIPDLNKFFLAQHLPAGSLGVIINTVPLFIYPFALLASEENFSWVRCSGIVIGVVGIMLLVTNGNLLQHHSLSSGWAALALLSPLLYAFCSVYIVKRRPQQCSSAMLCLGMLFCAAVLLLPLTLFEHLYSGMTAAAAAAVAHAAVVPTTFTYTYKIITVILLEIVLTTAGYMLLFEILRRAGSVCYSLTDGVVALTSLCWGAVIFGEKITWCVACGTVLILLGIVIVVRRGVGAGAGRQKNANIDGIRKYYNLT